MLWPSETPIGDHRVLFDDDAFDDSDERAPMKQLSSTIVGLRLNRLENAADADADASGGRACRSARTNRPLAQPSTIVPSST
mgnify:CR=1 FL=1